jgi:hypothetical protein
MIETAIEEPKAISARGKIATSREDHYCPAKFFVAPVKTAGSER